MFYSLESVLPCHVSKRRLGNEMKFGKVWLYAHQQYWHCRPGLLWSLHWHLNVYFIATSQIFQNIADNWSSITVQICRLNGEDLWHALTTSALVTFGMTCSLCLKSSDSRNVIPSIGDWQSLMSLIFRSFASRTELFTMVHSCHTMYLQLSFSNWAISDFLLILQIGLSYEVKWN